MAGFQAQWAVNEFAGIDLNDKRLNTRVVTIATQFGTIGKSSPDAMKCVQQRAKTSPVTTVNLAATSDVTDRLVPSVITLNVVEVREPNPPAGEVAIHWILVTTLPIHTDEQVAAIVAACKIRWNIEVLFTTLKSSLHLEDLQYQDLANFNRIVELPGDVFR